MSDYYKEEMLWIAEGWNIAQLEAYIENLEARVVNTKDMIRTMKTLKKRKMRNSNLKETGTRGGK